jgi:hypothetical protein
MPTATTLHFDNFSNLATRHLYFRAGCGEISTFNAYATTDDEITCDRCRTSAAFKDAHAAERKQLLGDVQQLQAQMGWKDHLFQSAVIAQHGAKRAGDMRYRQDLDNDATHAARVAFHDSSAEWRMACDRLRAYDNRLAGWGTAIKRAA